MQGIFFARSPCTRSNILRGTHRTHTTVAAKENKTNARSLRDFGRLNAINERRNEKIYSHCLCTVSVFAEFPWSIAHSHTHTQSRAVIIISGGPIQRKIQHKDCAPGHTERMRKLSSPSNGHLIGLRDAL